MNTRKSCFFVALSVVLLLPISAAAHKMNVFAWVSGNEILGEVKFSGGRRAKHVSVEAQDAATHAVLLESKTNDKGEFKFVLSAEILAKKPDLLIVASVGDGHRGDWLLKADEYAGTEGTATPAATDDISSVAPAPSSAPEETRTAAESSPQPAASRTTQQTAATTGVDQQLLRRIVAEEVNKALNPVRRTLAENSKHTPTLQDILGGIGWIVGMAGIAAWVQSRWKKQS